MTKYAKVYAGALYSLAKEENREAAVLKDLNCFCDILRAEPEYQKLISSPAVPKEERKQLLRDAFLGSFDQYTFNFLCLLCDENGFSEIFNCGEEFKNLYNKDNGILEVTLTSAVKLTGEQKEKLLLAIGKKTGKNIRLFEKLDPSVIGGLRLSVGGIQYDNTISYHLGQISQLLENN